MNDSTNAARLLFVDDERRVLTSMRAMFRRDYDVFLAGSGEEALEVLERQAIDVIVSDQRMPGMTGVDVLKVFRDRAPGAMRVLLTGYADQDAITASINEGEVFRFLTKPCAPDLLRETIGLAAQAATTPHELPAPGQRAATVEVLLLSGDAELQQHLRSALGRSRIIHHAADIAEAVHALGKHSVGVLITDMAIDADDVQALTSQLKRYRPELVTVVASDHADAHRLIELINGGQVYRFLLKPIKQRQTAIWIDSAAKKHVELLANPELIARHVVTSGDGSMRRLVSRVAKLVTRLARLRRRAA